MRDTRNQLIHGYAHVDLRVVWDTVQDDLAGLIEKLEQLLGREDAPPASPEPESSKKAPAHRGGELPRVRGRDPTLIVEMDPTIISVFVRAGKIRVELRDGRDVAIPLRWSPRLLASTQAQRRNVQIVEKGQALRWPDVDEDIAVSAILARDSIITFPPGSLLIADDGSLVGKDTRA